MIVGISLTLSRRPFLAADAADTFFLTFLSTSGGGASEKSCGMGVAQRVLHNKKNIHQRTDEISEARGTLCTNNLLHEEMPNFLCVVLRETIRQPDVIVIHEYLHVYRSSTAVRRR